ncbi:sortase [Aeromicrobium duanguangcaii]|uniref:sortase n=1 Tax=Aeromicrobium duanguangcaii TaxID=2968086 RepID=UPI002016BF8E|nr:sortase [Aeromicrobium duanguangcaii]MCL3837928.1 sortase [Aeromicrobium duanguangcaii]
MSGTSTRPRGSRLLLVVGLVLVLAGLGVLGWVGWQYFGTNIVSQRQHEKIRGEIVEEWKKPAQADEKKIDGRGLLRVPRFGQDFEVPILDGEDDATLSKGVGRNTDSALPGEVGNIVLSGHRITHGEPFRKFLDLRAGDEIEIETRTHVYTYRLLQDGDETRVPFTTSWPLWPVPDPDAAGEKPTKALVTLVTCSELFRTDDRNVVIGELEKTTPKDA